MSEEWRPVAGFEGKYEVSSLGRVRSLFRDPPLVLAQTRHARWGHHRVGLHRAGKQVTINVHRLVARAFIGEPTGPLVRHIDGDPSNNTPSNLAYGTSTDNNRDTVRHGRHYFASRTECPRGHAYTDENTYHLRGVRHCRRCNSIAVAAYKARSAA